MAASPRASQSTSQPLRHVAQPEATPSPAARLKHTVGHAALSRAFCMGGPAGRACSCHRGLRDPRADAREPGCCGRGSVRCSIRLSRPSRAVLSRTHRPTATVAPTTDAPLCSAPATAAFLGGGRGVRGGAAPRLPHGHTSSLPLPSAAPGPRGVSASRGFPTLAGPSARPPSLGAGSPHCEAGAGHPGSRRARVSCWATPSVCCGRPRGSESFVSNRFPRVLAPWCGHLTLRATVLEETRSLQGLSGAGWPGSQAA